MFAQADIDGQATVAVVGTTIVDMLFGDEDPIGKIIRVRHLPFRVIGVLARKGQGAGGGPDQDDTLFVPYTTAQRKIRGISWLDDIMCSTVSAAAVDDAEAQITALLRERHKLAPGEPDDFTVRRPQEQILLREQSARTLSLMLAAIASVSLVVGGIGIMNIMLVSVAERTREIGLRMALGARQRDIQRQFFAEALLLTLAGGLLGAGGGIAAANVMSRTLEWSMPVSPETLAVAMGFSTLAGLIFGYYPARHAARLDPIEALRAE